MRIIWFGDSWCAGAELASFYGHYNGQLGDRFLGVDPINEYVYYNDEFVKRYRPDLTFPAIISEKLGLDSYNYSRGGASINEMFSFLLEYLKTNLVENDILLFSLPTPWKRCYYIDNDGNVQTFTERNERLILQNQAERGKYDLTIMLNLLYSTCLINKVKPYFFSCWKHIDVLEKICIIPEEHFLFPLSTTLVELSWEDPRIMKINPNFKPCRGHPNILGHQKLAETLIPYINKIIRQNY